MKKIFLCRHGQSEYNAKKIIQGHIDTDLTPQGIVQARLIGERLKTENIEKIFSSDLKRAYKTATIIGDILGLDVEIDKRIREMHFGNWEGKAYEQIYTYNLDHWQKWLKNPVACPLPSQEDIKEFEKRIKSFWEYVNSLQEKNILIVGHGGSIQGIICTASGLGMEHLWGMMHTNTGLSLLEVKNQKTYIKYINEDFHLANYT
ncbi:MAG: histidine phosphatase family protein [Aquificae bacterium]|nr:histidine phosphatase family protein [Aquificota bacterium]